MYRQLPDFLDKPLKELPFVVLDLETTGFEPVSAGITEIAMISIRNGEEEIFEQLVNPNMPIPKQIVKITGITDEMVKDQPLIEEVIPIVDQILQDCIFVSHNVPFDWGFLDYATRKYLNKPLTMPSMCTLKLSRRFLNLSSNKLGAVAKHFNVNLENAHRAMNDTVAVKEILMGLLDRLSLEGYYTGRDLLEHKLIFPETPPVR
jgi:DNA polymerase III epsilon subunit family exonuclease